MTAKGPTYPVCGLSEPWADSIGGRKEYGIQRALLDAIRAHDAQREEGK